MKDTSRPAPVADVPAATSRARSLGKPLVVVGSIAALAGTFLPAVAALPRLGSVSLWGWSTDGTMRQYALIIVLCAVLGVLAGLGVIRQGLSVIAGAMVAVIVFSGIELMSTISSTITQCRVAAAGDEAATALCEAIRPGLAVWTLGVAAVVVIIGAVLASQEQPAREVPAPAPTPTARRRNGR